MLVNDEAALRSFCARILGWTSNRELVVEHAVRPIELTIDQSAALVVLGEFDLVPLAYALHRRMFGTDAPFILCDRRRGSTLASVRAAMNEGSGVAALEAARGGSLCVRFQRLPRDFSSVVAQLRSTEDARLILVGAGRFDTIRSSCFRSRSGSHRSVFGRRTYRGSSTNTQPMQSPS